MLLHCDENPKILGHFLAIFLGICPGILELCFPRLLRVQIQRLFAGLFYCDLFVFPCVLLFILPLPTWSLFKLAALADCFPVKFIGHGDSNLGWTLSFYKYTSAQVVLTINVFKIAHLSDIIVAISSQIKYYSREYFHTSPLPLSKCDLGHGISLSFGFTNTYDIPPKWSRANYIINLILRFNNTADLLCRFWPLTYHSLITRFCTELMALLLTYFAIIAQVAIIRIGTWKR